MVAGAGGRAPAARSARLHLVLDSCQRLALFLILQMEADVKS